MEEIQTINLVSWGKRRNWVDEHKAENTPTDQDYPVDLGDLDYLFLLAEMEHR